jgi:MATE family multidrug resistance protein
MDASAATAASRPGAPTNTIRADLAALLRLAWPVVLSRLGIMTMGLTDTIVVGRYSAVQLGYHALGWAPTAVVVTVALGLLTGVQVMTARMIGEGRRALAGAVLRRGMVYGLWLGLGSSVLLAVGGPPFLRAMGLSPGLADGATPVLLIFSLSLIPFTFSTVATLWLEALSKPQIPMAMMWLANGVNLAADLILVPGRLGAPALGAMGGACATLASRSALTIALLIYIACMREARELGVFARPARDRVAAAEQRHVGYGAGASNFFEVAAFAGMNLVAGWVSVQSLAAYTVVINIIALVFMVPLGLSTASAVLVGTAYGARRPREVVRATVVGGATTALFALAASVAAFFAAREIAEVWSKDPQVLALAGAGLVLSCLMLVPDALQVVLASALRARADVVAPSVTHFVSYVVIMAPMAWWLALPRGMGLNGIIWAIIVASYVSAGLLIGRFWFVSRD